MCHPGYHHNSFMATHELGHNDVRSSQCWYSRTKECSNYYKSNEHNVIGGNVIQDIHRVLKLLKEQ